MKICFCGRLFGPEMNFKVLGGRVLYNSELDEMFDDEKLTMAIKKRIRKSSIKMIFISLVVITVAFIAIYFANLAITHKLSNEIFGFNENNIKLHVPNGYISKSTDSMGFLVGRSDYTVSRDVAAKPVVLENKVSAYGLLTPLVLGRSQGVGSFAGEWSVDYWENGYRKMIFFNPEISYKEYKNDLDELDKVSSDKLIELGLSFDKPYIATDMPTILPLVKISWYWVDAFRKEDSDRHKKQATENDGKATYIREDDALGVSVYHDLKDFNEGYNNLRELLKSSKDNKYNEIYNELVAKGYTDSSNVPILGVIVYGTKDELKLLIDNPHIKASSFGVVVDKY
ncbi:Sigma factor regulator N-terminal [Desulfosporosinus lacus DSM 15449]|uniref:Sigma factor regulator N-terminal n=1 Tax=Desulfosporosinus lacus DSM 15449 TaxID=1121420 RepID=A0A1M6ERT9_9FIRM|nr:Sigma factor regulator N-terminal [Desulfosporosinus lacus DSM 15449]